MEVSGSQKGAVIPQTFSAFMQKTQKKQKKTNAVSTKRRKDVLQMPLAHTNVFSLASSGTPRCNNNLGASRKSANSSVMADGVIRGTASSQRNSSCLCLEPPSFQQIANFRANFQEKNKTKQNKWEPDVFWSSCWEEAHLKRITHKRYRIERSIKNETNK